jgi:hypothetical protein
MTSAIDDVAIDEYGTTYGMVFRGCHAVVACIHKAHAHSLSYQFYHVSYVDGIAERIRAHISAIVVDSNDIYAYLGLLESFELFGEGIEGLLMYGYSDMARNFMETTQSLCRRVLRLDDRDGFAFICESMLMLMDSWMCACKDEDQHVCIIKTRLTKYDVGKRVCMYTYLNTLPIDIYNDFMVVYIDRDEPWSRFDHRFLWRKQNQPFATLLLALQRLEDTGVIQEAHKSMIEDMLTCIRWSDCL